MGTAKRERQKANRQLKQQQVDKIKTRARRKRLIIRVVVALIAAVVGLLVLRAALGNDDSDDTPVDSVPIDTTVTDTAPSDTSVTDTAPADTSVTDTAAPAAFTYGTGECAPADKPAEPVRSFSDAPAECIDTAKTYTATFTTNKGTIVVELADDTVPGTVNNFVTLARYGYYDDTPIFRADPSIDIIQGGGENNTSSPGYTIPDEASGFTYTEGDLAMARTGEPNSAGAQWFFVGGPNASALDGQGTYVNFGRVTEGLDVVKAILALAGDDGQTPSEDVTISSVEITES